MIRWICSWWRWFIRFISWGRPKEFKPLYENLYELDNMANETDENYKKEQVEEETPAGKIRMKYDEEEKCFLYWADHNIPMRYLNTVARKYVTVFDKREWYEKTEVEYTQRKQAELSGPFVQSKQVRRIEISKKMNRFKKKGAWKEEEIKKREEKKISYLDYKNDYANVIFQVDERVHDGTDGTDGTGRPDTVF